MKQIKEKDLQIFPVGTDKKIVYEVDEQGVSFIKLVDEDFTNLVRVSPDLLVEGDQSLIELLRATSVYPFTDESQIRQAAEELAQNLNKVEDSDMNHMVEQSNLSKRIIDADFNKEAILGISENYENLHTDDVRIESNDESVAFTGDGFFLKFRSNGEFNFRVELWKESGTYETLRDINEICKSVNSMIEIGTVEDSIEQYTQADLLKNPPKYARDIEVWKECVAEATNNGEKTVPIVTPILLYKDKMQITDADSIQDMINRINKEVSKEYDDKVYISWSDRGKGTIYVEDYDIGELQVQNDGIKRIELWDKSHVGAFEKILKAINKVSDSVYFNFTKAGLTELICKQGKLVVDAKGYHQIVKINGFRVADYYKGNLQVNKQFTSRLYKPNSNYQVSCSRFLKIIDSITVPCFSIRRIEDAMDVRLLKTIVESNLEHYKITADVSTSGNRVRVSQSGSILATIEVKSDGFEVQATPSCPDNIKKALLEIKDEGSDVVKDEKTGDMKESFKKHINDISKAFEAVAKTVGKDAKEATVAVAGPVGAIASELLNVMKSVKSK